MTLIVGQLALFKGDVTQMKAVGALAPSHVEEMLGYHQRRLSRGYWICLLVEPLTPSDFEFAGNTLRSGGRLGLPETTNSAEHLRPRVHDKILRGYGPNGYADLQNHALSGIPPTGENRIAKVVPATPHAKFASPAFQYPMGGGALQWRLTQPKPFRVAVFVNARGEAQTVDFTVRIDAGARYDDRARLRRYLEIVI